MTSRTDFQTKYKQYARQGYPFEVTFFIGHGLYCVVPKSHKQQFWVPGHPKRRNANEILAFLNDKFLSKYDDITNFYGNNDAIDVRIKHLFDIATDIGCKHVSSSKNVDRLKYAQPKTKAIEYTANEVAALQSWLKTAINDLIVGIAQFKNELLQRQLATQTRELEKQISKNANANDNNNSNNNNNSIDDSGDNDSSDPELTDGEIQHYSKILKNTKLSKHELRVRVAELLQQLARRDKKLSNMKEANMRFNETFDFQVALQVEKRLGKTKKAKKLIANLRQQVRRKNERIVFLKAKIIVVRKQDNVSRTTLWRDEKLMNEIFGEQRVAARDSKIILALGSDVAINKLLAKLRPRLEKRIQMEIKAYQGNPMFLLKRRHRQLKHHVSDKAMIAIVNCDKFETKKVQNAVGRYVRERKILAHIPKSTDFGINLSSNLRSFTAVLQASKILRTTTPEIFKFREVAGGAIVPWQTLVPIMLNCMLCETDGAIEYTKVHGNGEKKQKLQIGILLMFDESKGKYAQGKNQHFTDLYLKFTNLYCRDIACAVSLLFILGLFAETDTSNPTQTQETMVVFRWVTRGTSPNLVKTNIATNWAILKHYPNIRMEVVTDNEIGINTEKFGMPKHLFNEMVVPKDYVTPNKSLFKARALYYAAINSEFAAENPNCYIFHCDEESTVTESLIKGVQQFTKKHYGEIGQGMITYRNEEFSVSSYLCHLCDSVRVGDDRGRFRFQFKLLNRAVCGLKGSFVLIPNQIETNHATFSILYGMGNILLAHKSYLEKFLTTLCLLPLLPLLLWIESCGVFSGLVWPDKSFGLVKKEGTGVKNKQIDIQKYETQEIKQVVLHENKKEKENETAYEEYGSPIEQLEMA